MSRQLPLRASLEWLRKLGKERLRALREADPKAKLNQVQLDIAREFGFPNWRKLKAHVEYLQERLDAVVPSTIRQRAAGECIAPDDPALIRLLELVAAGETQAVADMLGRRPALALAHGLEGETPLHVAAQCNDPQLAALLVAFGADLRAKFGESGHSPLSWAITCNAIECARTLVRLGAEPDLFCAAGMGALDEVRSFFGASDTLVPGASQTGSSRFAADGSRLACPPLTAGEQVSDALSIACRNGQADVVGYLVTKQPDLSFRAYLGATPLHWAHFGGSRAAIELLEQCGADPAARDDLLNCTPRAFGICVAANWGFVFLVCARLAEDPTLIDFMDGSTSALHEAVAQNHAEVVRLLLDRGASVSLANGAGKSPLDLAIERGHLEIAAMLRAAGA